MTVLQYVGLTMLVIPILVSMIVHYGWKYTVYLCIAVPATFAYILAALIFLTPA